ncbi:hypothetical protein C1J05_09965 [Sulfitobacter sp. JL08]|nr:hypothetical protein C1J05_09965 [Sulfitobacter sp. JL08]
MGFKCRELNIRILHEIAATYGRILSEDRRSRLEALGFEWGLRAPPWEKLFAELVRYKDVHGDCNVPYGWPENEKLASWVTTQRTNAVKGNLTDERRQRLKAIGFRF